MEESALSIPSVGNKPAETDKVNVSGPNFQFVVPTRVATAGKGEGRGAPSAVPPPPV
jgi:hypothetical protein